MIIELLSKQLRQCQISTLLGIKKEKVSYWPITEIKDYQQKVKKLNEIYIDKIQKWANNKVTSLRSSRKIVNMINSILLKRKEVDKKGKQISVYYTTINNYLKDLKKFGKYFYSQKNKR